MKRNLLTLIVFFCFTAWSLNAEDNGNPNMYAGCFGGVNFLSTSHRIFKPETGFTIGIFTGIKLDKGFRAEIEVAYRNNQGKGKNYPIMVKNATAISLMTNIIKDFDTGTCLTPFIGAGVGSARLDFKFIDKEKHHNRVSRGKVEKWLCYQVFLGVNYKLSRQMDIGVEYRFFQAQKKIYNHSILVSLTHSF